MATGILVDSQCVTQTDKLVLDLASYKQELTDQGYPLSWYFAVEINRSMQSPSIRKVYWDLRDDANAHQGKSTQFLDYSQYESCTFSNASDSNGNELIDYSQSAEFWGFAFVTIMSFYIVSKNIGLILEAVKKW